MGSDKSNDVTLTFRTSATDACSTFHEKSVLSAAFLRRSHKKMQPHIHISHELN